MRIRVRYLSRARELTGKGEEELELLDGSKLRELIALLISKYGEGFEDYLGDPERPSPLIFVDGRPANDPDLVLRGGSEVVFMSAVAGG